MRQNVVPYFWSGSAGEFQLDLSNPRLLSGTRATYRRTCFHGELDSFTPREVRDEIKTKLWINAEQIAGELLTREELLLRVPLLEQTTHEAKLEPDSGVRPLNRSMCHKRIIKFREWYPQQNITNSNLNFDSYSIQNRPISWLQSFDVRQTFVIFRLTRVRRGEQRSESRE